MNKIFRDSYFHISNGGCHIRVEEDEKTKFPVLVFDWHTFGNLKTTFNMLTRKEYIHALGVMLIEAASMCEEPDWSGQTLAKMEIIVDGNGKELSRPEKEHGFEMD